MQFAVCGNNNSNINNNNNNKNIFISRGGQRDRGAGGGTDELPKFS